MIEEQNPMIKHFMCKIIVENEILFTRIFFQTISIQGGEDFRIPFNFYEILYFIVLSFSLWKRETKLYSSRIR